MAALERNEEIIKILKSQIYELKNKRFRSQNSDRIRHYNYEIESLTKELNKYEQIKPSNDNSLSYNGDGAIPDSE